MFEYRAQAVKVIDGDTLDLDVDLGFNVTFRARFRLLDVSAPELTAKDPVERQKAVATKRKFEELIAAAPFQLTVKTVKDRQEKYGRYLATIIAGDVDINAALNKFLREY